MKSSLWVRFHAFLVAHRLVTFRSSKWGRGVPPFTALCSDHSVLATAPFFVTTRHFTASPFAFGSCTVAPLPLEVGLRPPLAPLACHFVPCSRSRYRYLVAPLLHPQASRSAPCSGAGGTDSTHECSTGMRATGPGCLRHTWAMQPAAKPPRNKGSAPNPSPESDPPFHSQALS
jgi:hypothetical protein